MEMGQEIIEKENPKFIIEVTDKEIYHNKINFTIKSTPFNWNDKMGEEALDMFEDIQSQLSYDHSVVIGTALAKLALLENQGAKVKNE